MSNSIATSRPSHHAGVVSPHLRILASAGSGKTWQLSSRYLSLTWSGVDPERILASTFTRLAAGEIRDRILERLAEAAEDEAKRRLLSREALGRESASREEVISGLGDLARSIHRMNIRTLDSFFASIVTSFPFELGIPPGCRIVDEDEGGALRAEAVRRMLDEQDPQPLVETLRLLTRGDSQRSVWRTIDFVISDLFDIALETRGDAWDSLPQLDVLDYAELVRRIEAFCAFDRLGDGRRVKAHRRACEHARSHEWKAFLGTGIASKVAVGVTAYYGALEADIIEAYMPLVKHARNWVINQYRGWNLATRDLLAEFTRHYDAVKRERRVMTFDDLTHALERAGSVGTLDEICYRLDAQLEHVLLDEFQDTSVAQWRALHPVLHELVSDETTGRSFFCVGDLKQSIYEWRDASPDILENLPELLFGAGAGEQQLPSRPLDVNWRSASPVIKAVNTVFGSLQRNSAVDKYREFALAWQEAFQPHEIAEKNKVLPGYVELATVGRGDSSEQERQRIDAVIDRIGHLHATDPSLRIGVLSRTNKMGNRILARLQRQGLPVSGPGGGPLTDVPVINALLDLLQLASAPEDSAAAFHVARSPLGAILDFREWDYHGKRRLFSRNLRRRLYETGFGPLLAGLVPHLAPCCGSRERRRLLRLIDVAETFDAVGTRDIDSFIQTIEQREVADARPTPIQVLTIHKAKGMEWDAVILPELGSPLVSGRAKYVYERDGVVGPITRITRYLRKEAPDVRELLEQVDCDVSEMFRQDQHRRVRETLCMLYVAMTRAKQGLYMIIDPPKLNKDGSVNANSLRSLAGVVWWAMCDGAIPTADSIVASIGDAEWFVEKQGRKRPDPETPTPVAPHAGAQRDAQLGLFDPAEPPIPPERGDTTDDAASEAAVSVIELQSPGRPRVGGDRAASTLARGVRLREWMEPPSREATDRGTAAHALFEQIEWIEDFDGDDAALRTMLRQRLTRRSDQWIGERIAEFRNALASDSIRATLSRSGAADGLPVPRDDEFRLRVWRERPFVRLTAEGLQRGAIDRLVVAADATGRPIAARIIDFKTDRVDEGTVEAYVDRYRPQLESYRDAVAGIFDLGNEAIELTIVFIHDRIVRAV